MEKRFALRKKKKRGFEYVTHLGWLGMIRPTVSDNFMSPMIEDSLLWGTNELAVERKGRTILSLIQEYLPDYELVSVSTSANGALFILDQENVFPDVPERKSTEQSPVENQQDSNRLHQTIPVVAIEPEMDKQMFFAFEEEPEIELEPEPEMEVEMEVELEEEPEMEVELEEEPELEEEELYEYEPEHEPVAELEDEMEYYGRINLFDTAYASY